MKKSLKMLAYTTVCFTFIYSSNLCADESSDDYTESEYNSSESDGSGEVEKSIRVKKKNKFKSERKGKKKKKRSKSLSEKKKKRRKKPNPDAEKSSESLSEKKKKRRKESNPDAEKSSDDGEDSSRDESTEEDNFSKEDDWRDEIPYKPTSGEDMANADGVIFDPVIDSSQFHASTIESRTISTEKFTNGTDNVDFSKITQDLKSTPQMIVSKNVDDGLSEISEKISCEIRDEFDVVEQKIKIQNNVRSVDINRDHRTAPKEAIKFRQELEVYRQLYAKNLKEENLSGLV
ncbi:MAG: hypothetical protein LBS23_01065 [Holosporaceae bacterium]|jgi:hypothetical protein|nr:hypothetical protein [Holosporaceae bacterium]